MPSRRAGGTPTPRFERGVSGMMNVLDTRTVLGRSVSKAGLLILGLLAFDVVLWGVLGAIYFLARQHLSAVIVPAGLSVPVQMALLLTIGPVRAMARQTFHQCIRTKVAVAFIVLLVGALGIVCTQMKGDGTLAGQLRTLLAYGMGLIAFLQSVVTVFLAAGLICNDVRDKTIFSVTSKPLPRWQYILGRWMGLVLVNLVLLVPASGLVYGMAQYFRYQDRVAGLPVEPRDRLAVETEVFTARRIVQAKPFDIDSAVQKRWDYLRQDPKQFDSIVREHKQQNKIDDEPQALAGVAQQIRKQILAVAQSAGPLPPDVNPGSIDDVIAFADSIGYARDPKDPLDKRPTFEWKFSGLHVSGSEVAEKGTILGNPQFDEAQTLMRVAIRCTPQFLSHLTVSGPVKVNQVFGQVEAVKRDGLWAQFRVRDFGPSQAKALTEGAEVAMVAEPRFQVTYKAQAVESKGDDTVRGAWIAENPTTRGRFVIWRDDPSKVQSTLTFPISAVDDQGNTLLRFINRTPSTVTIFQEDVGVMYRISSFESNFVRGAMLILLQVAFLAAAGLLASSFLSYPVACFVTMFVMPLTLMREFLNQSVDPTYWTGFDFWAKAGYVVMKVANPLLPDFGSTSASDGLVGGLAFPWPFMGEMAFVQIAVRVLLILALACVIFERRELAQVQV